VQDGSKAILMERGKGYPMSEQLKKPMDEIQEEHHEILFIYKAGRQRNGNFIEQLENDLLQKKDPFPKTVVNPCRILVGLKNWYGNKSNRFSEANDDMAFTITGDENNKKDKKKEVTRFKCKNVGHYSNKCDKEIMIKTSNIQGSSFLVLNKDEQDSSSEEVEDDMGHINFDHINNLEAVAEQEKESSGEEEGSVSNSDGDDDVMESDDDDSYKDFGFLNEDIKPGIPGSWILLDSQLLLIFCNPRLLTNIRHVSGHSTYIAMQPRLLGPRKET